MPDLKRIKNIAVAAAVAAVAIGNVMNFIPKGSQDAGIVFYDTSPDKETSDAFSSETDGADGREDSGKDAAGLLNINTATAEELQTLSGIGPVKAQAIIDYRNAYGGFVSAEEITEVKGIGEATYSKIIDFITIE